MYVVTLLAFDDATDPTPLQVSSSLAVPCSLKWVFARS